MNTRIDWSECIEVFSKVDCLSLSGMDIKAFFNEDRYGVLLPLLEKGMGETEIHKVDAIESILKASDIDLGEEKERWVGVLSQIMLETRKVNGVSFELVYCRQVDQS